MPICTAFLAIFAPCLVICLATAFCCGVAGLPLTVMPFIWIVAVAFWVESAVSSARSEEQGMAIISVAIAIRKNDFVFIVLYFLLLNSVVRV